MICLMLVKALARRIPAALVQCKSACFGRKKSVV
jgi:hypothetical protein